MIGLQVPVLTECKPDKSDDHQYGAGHHQPVRKLHCLEKRPHFRASARSTNIAGPGLSLTGAFNVKSQPVAFPDVVWIDACRLKGADMQKHIRTAGVVCDETEAAIGIPHFQYSGSHCLYFPFTFSPSSTRRRMASERVTPFAFPQAKMEVTTSAGTRAEISGS
jgi:hypothetical protein